MINIIFNGLLNIIDLKNLINFQNNNISFNKINSLLDQQGKIYNLLNNDNIIDKGNYQIYDFFNYIYKEIYEIGNLNKKIKLKISGYSIGGPLSQYFTHFIIEQYNDSFDIEICNIESWFKGNSEEYNKFKNLMNISKIKNIYNNNSLFYFNNIFFQKYFSITNLINNDNDNDNDYEIDLFPFGIINYFMDNHLLKKDIQK